MKKILIILSFVLHTTMSFSQEWRQIGSNSIGELNNMDFLNADTGIIVGSGGTILHTTDGGENWTTINVNFTNYLYSVCYVNDTLVFAVGENAKYYVSENGGLNWEEKSIPSLEVQLFDIDITPNGKGIIVGMNETILWTNDFGNTWDLIRTDYWGIDFRQQLMNDSTVFIYGTNALPAPLITYSYDACETLEFRDFFPFYNNSMYLSYLEDAYIKNADSGVFVGVTEFGDGFVTNDMDFESQKWDADLYPAALFTLDCKDQDCFAGGVNNSDNPFFLYSNSFGKTWTQETLYNLNAAIHNIEFFNNSVFALGTNGLILKKDLTTHLPQTEAPQLSVSLSPNPASDMLVITTNFQATTPLFLEIVDLKGNVLRSFTLETESTNSTYRQPLSQLSSGVYLVKIFNAQGFQQTSKLIINKVD